MANARARKAAVNAATHPVDEGKAALTLSRNRYRIAYYNALEDAGIVADLRREETRRADERIAVLHQRIRDARKQRDALTICTLALSAGYIVEFLVRVL